MVDDGDRPAGGVRDFIILPLKIDGVIVIDPPLGAQREVQIQKAGSGPGADAGIVFSQRFFPHFQWDPACAALDGAVLTMDFHLEDFVGALPSLDSGVRQEGDEAFLESAEASFDFAFGLGSWRDEVSDGEAQQGALELASGIAVIVAGTWTEEAQSVCVDGFWQAVCFEDAPEMAEVIPSRLSGDEAARNIETGMVVDGQQEDLFTGRWPPLVNGTIMLKKFTNARPAEAPVGPLFAQRSCHEMGEEGFDMSLDAGTSPLETIEPLQFICHQLVIGRILQGQKAFQESADLRRPVGRMVAATGLWLVGLPVAQVVATEFIEPGFTDAQMSCGSGCVQFPMVEIGEDADDKNGRQAVNELFLFKAGISSRASARCDLERTGQGRPGRGISAASLQPLRRPPLRSGLLRGCRDAGVNRNMHRN
jgi:hypothetical protein